MDEKTRLRIISLYKRGYSIRAIQHLGVGYKREQIRKTLKKATVAMRNRVNSYKEHSCFSEHDARLFAELLGYLYGDGSLHKNKTPIYGEYDCVLTFSLNELDLVERVEKITMRLFAFKPRVIRKPGIFVLKFKKSFAKYLSIIGYPVGKKSKINPCLPMQFFPDAATKAAFLRGFFNAEASINTTVAVQQSVRIDIPVTVKEKLIPLSRSHVMRGKRKFFIRWREAKRYIHDAPTSNILKDTAALLIDLGDIVILS